jgi:predicted transport protein
MLLFKNKDSSLTSIERDSFKLEKDIQALVEANLDTLFGLELVTSEFTVGEFRLDSLAFDEQSNAFVIVEYKKGHSYSVVDQGYSYLSVMLNNKAEFILEYNERTGKQLKRTDIDWSNSRVLFVSPSFNTYQRNSVNFRDVPFELWEIKKFDGGLIALEQCKSTSNESIEKVTGTSGNSVISKVSSEVKVMSEADHVASLDPALKSVWEALRERLEGFSDTSFSTSKVYVSWKRENTAICFIRFRKKAIRMLILRGNLKEGDTSSNKLLTFDDPKKMAKEYTRLRANGYIGYAYTVILTKVADLDYVIFLLEQKYKSLE